VGGGQKVGMIVIVGTGSAVPVNVDEGTGSGESGSLGTGCATSVNVDEGMGLGKSGSLGTSCAVAVNVNVGEEMGLDKSGSSVVVWKQPTNITDTNNGIKIVIRFIRYSL